MLRFEIIDVAVLKSPLGLKGASPSNVPKVPLHINQVQKTAKSEQTIYSKLANYIFISYYITMLYSKYQYAN